MGAFVVGGRWLGAIGNLPEVGRKCLASHPGQKERNPQKKKRAHWGPLPLSVTERRVRS